jgi:hypothetical protein
MKSRVFEFNQGCREAYNKLKQALILAPVITHFVVGREIVLETDTLDGVVGGLLI